MWGLVRFWTPVSLTLWTVETCSSLFYWLGLLCCRLLLLLPACLPNWEPVFLLIVATSGLKRRGNKTNTHGDAQSTSLRRTAAVSVSSF